MFHVLAADVPVLKAESVKILCDVKTPREAITLKKFIQFYGQNKLNTERCCKVCYKKAVFSAK